MTLRIHTRMRVRIQVLSMLTVLFSLMGARPAAAQYFAARGWCESGAQPIVTSGLISTTLAQASYPQCTVTVFNTGGGLATIYSSESGASLSNPFTAQTNGQWIFFAAASSSSTATYDVTLSGAGMPSTVTYSAIALGGGGGGGGGGSPAGPAGSLQFANSAVDGFSSVSSVGVNSIISPTQLNLGLNTAISGPRPYIDVTAPPYNADPTGSVDATTAIQSAITAACAISTSVGRPGVYFPPGKYTVSQPQTPSTSPVFTTCGDLYLYSNGSQSLGAQFRSAPEGASINVTAGASPNAAAVFDFRQQNDSTVENLAMNCHNECIDVYASSGTHITNDSLSVPVTGQTDNAPLKITNSFWAWISGGTLQTTGGGSGSVPTFLMTGDTPNTSEAPLTGLIFMRDVTTAGGGFEYLQKVAATSGIGTWSFRNVTQEDPAMAFLTIAESSPGLIGGSNFPSNIMFDTDQQSDTVGGTAGILMYETTQNQVWAEISVTNSTGPLVSTGTNNDENKASSFISYGSSGTARSNANGPLGVQLTNNYDAHSFDLLSEAFDPTNSGSSAKDCSGLISDCDQHGLAAIRLFSNRTNYSTLGLDASQGVMFGGGNSQGYTSALQQSANSAATLDVLTTKLPAPTNVTATATTGGSLANGTYYVTLWATSNNGGAPPLRDCFQTPLSLSSTMIASPFPVTLSGGNNAISVTWTAPVAGPTSPANYCMQVLTSDPNSGALTDKRVSQGLEFAAPATSFLYTGQAQVSNGTSFLAQTILTPVHRFTYNALGVNTLSPSANSITLGVGGFNGAITHANTANRTYTFPDASGTVCLTSAVCGGLNFQNGGTPIGSAPTFNCGTNTSCAIAGGVLTIQATSTASTAWSTLTASTNNNAGTFVSTNNSWDFGGASGFKVPTAGLNFPGSASGTVLVVAQAAAGTPTLTLPTSTGTFAATATLPAAIDPVTGNLTVAAATTGATGVIQLAGDLGGTATSPTVVSTHITGATGNRIVKFSFIGADVVNSNASDTGALYTIPEPLDLTTNPQLTEIANAGVTGTTANKLASLTGAPSTAVITTAASTSGAVGIVINNAGTAGNAQIAIDGQASCVFDGATTAGHYVSISASVNGDCTDAGSTYPTSGQVLGLALSTNAGTGTYGMLLFGPGAQGFSGGGGSGTVGNCLTSTAVAYYPSSGTTTGCLSSITEAAGVIHIGTSGSVLGQLTLAGSSSGTITIQPQAAAGTYNFNLPTVAGTANAPLLSGGGGATAQSYSSILYLTSLNSGGVVYGSSSTQLASSATLTANGIMYGGGSGTAPTVIAPPTTNGTYLCGYLVIASASVPPTCQLQSIPVNTQTGTTYTIGAANTWSDRGTLITASNSSAQTYTAVNPSSSGFGSNTFYAIDNIGTNYVTENASGFQINGSTSLTIPPKWVGFHWSDNTNYWAGVFPSVSAFPNCPDTAGNHLNFDTSQANALVCGVTIATNVVTSSSALTINQAVNGRGSQAVATGFADTSGTITSGHLACYTATGIDGNCTAMGSVLGVFNTATSWLASGETSIVLDATQNVTVGDNICQSATTVSDGYDNGNVACPTGLAIGIVQSSASSVSSATIFVALR